MVGMDVMDTARDVGTLLKRPSATPVAAIAPWHPPTSAVVCGGIDEELVDVGMLVLCHENSGTFALVICFVIATAAGTL